MWKFAVFAAVLAAIVAITAGTVSITAGPPAYVVNTTADDPDSDAAIPACDTGSGDCTLRAAIEQANEAGGGAITFDAAVFPAGAPATIAIDATGNGELPTIVVPLTIDGSGAGVVLEPAPGSMLDFGLFVLDDTPGDATSFAITGNSFTIRGFEDTEANDDAEGDGIFICGDGGDGCGSGRLRGVTISGMNIEDVAGAAVRIDGGDGSDVTFTDNDDLAGNHDAAVEVDLGDDSSLTVIDGASLSGDSGVKGDVGDGSDVTISRNDSVDGADDGINIDVGDDSSVDIEDNGDMAAVSGDAVTVDTGDGSEVLINANGQLTGGDNAIELELGGGTTAHITDNGDLTGTTDPSVEVEIGPGSLVAITGHALITTSENAAIEAVLDAGAELFVFDNGQLIGDDEGVLVEAGDNSIVRVINNDEVIGLGDNAIDIEGPATELHINLNGTIRGEFGAGIDVNGGVTGGEVHTNGSILGEDGRGIDISADLPGSEINDLLIYGNAIENGSEDAIRLKCDVDDGCTGGTGNEIYDNLITSNELRGILIEGPLSETSIHNNTITDNDGPGIHIIDSSDNRIVDNVIARNGNDTTGILIEEDDGEARRNTISQNSIYANDDLGIDLDADRVTDNDEGDTDEGPNDLLNFPEELAIDVSQVLTGQACAGCLVEVFVTDNPPDQRDHGEGMTYIGDVTADGGGAFTLDLSAAPCGSDSGAVTTTATDAAGNTSEFSENVGGFEGVGPCFTPQPTPTPEATSTPTATATPTATQTPKKSTDTPTATLPPPADGDVNKDGMTNSLDGLLVLQASAGLIPAVPFPDNGDVNLDGVIDSLDAVLILQFNAGLIDSLPV
ncbi:MAG: right-handed parallel beta-helix repeat-containing protein [Chloroflexi bacterium]|nr:right-handed parallel beta-helix repeat-containing protein [Chloroflexota bacterium]